MHAHRRARRRRPLGGRVRGRRSSAAGSWTIEAWTDALRELARRAAAASSTPARTDLSGELSRGRRAARARPPARAKGADRAAHRARARRAARRRRPARRDVDAALDPELFAPSSATPTAPTSTAIDEPLAVDVDRVRARFGAWYELFPRSWGGCRASQSSSPRARRARLRRPLPAADPPDRRARTARAPTTRSSPARRPGTPVGDRRRDRRPRRAPPRPRHDGRLRRARARPRASTASTSRWTSRSSARPTTRGCTEHPEWFNRRPDGTLKYAENPPKKYQDIYNVNFDCEDWRGLWEALRDVVLLLGRARRQGLPRRQPAHQAARRSGSG